MRTSSSVLNAIRQHGRDAYPEEGCGFLLGRLDPDGDHHVEATHPAANRHEGARSRRFALTPADYRAADEAARQQDLDVVGFYHSHPDHPAQPSPTDLADAPFPGYAYVIVSVREGQPADITAWQLTPDRSRFVEDDIATDKASV